MFPGSFISRWVGILIILVAAGLPRWSEGATTTPAKKRPGAGASTARSAPVKKPAATPAKKALLAGTAKPKPAASKAIVKKTTPAAASKKPAAAAKSGGTAKSVAASGKRPLSSAAARTPAPPAKLKAGTPVRVASLAKPGNPPRGKTSEANRMVPNAVSDAAVPTEVDVPPVPFSDGVLGADKTGSSATPMIPVLGFGGTSGAAASSVELAAIEPALPKPETAESPVPKAADPPPAVAAGPASSAEPEPPAPEEPPIPPPVHVARPGPPTKTAAVVPTPTPPPAPSPTSPTPMSGEPTDLAPTQTAATAEPRPAPSTQPTAALAKAMIEDVTQREIPFPTDDPPVLKTSLTPTPPARLTTPSRMPQPSAVDELAPKPPEKKGSAFAVPAAAGELLIAANVQTDFQVKDKRIVFKGNVIMKNERFYLTADKLVAYMKEKEGGLDFAQAEGNVVVRMVDRGQETGSSGLSKTAVFHPKTGEIVLRGWPQVRFGNKAHVASSATTEMSLFTDGRMKTTGRNQTMIVP